MLTELIEQYMPYQSPKLVAWKPCLYTNSFDGNFLVDEPKEGLLVIGAMSGHGFKFLPAVAATALEFFDPSQKQNHHLLNIDLFSFNRFWADFKNPTID